MRSAWLIISVLALAASGCSDDTGGGSGGAGGTGSGGDTGSSGGGEPAGTGGGPSTGDTSSVSAGGGGGSSTSTGATTSTGTTSTAETTGTTGGGVDELEDERQLCVDTINALRATEGLPPLARWVDAEMCSDTSATSDEQSGTPHGAFGSCGEGAQNECLGHGPSGIVQCLNQMWDERLQENCAGCSACDAPGDCPNCDFFGPPACGHYVNMRAPWHTQVACGFSALGGWDVQNFR